MKLVYPEINSVIVLRRDNINTLVIENPSLMYRFINDLHEQSDKKDGRAVLSRNNELLDINKNIELITDIYGIDLNSKKIISKIFDELNKKAVDEVHYEATMKILGELQVYFQDLSWDMECEINSLEMNAKQLLKTFTFEVVDDSSDLTERVLKYMETVRQFLGDKLFIFVNLRGFIEENQFRMLNKTLIEHDFCVLFIDNKEYVKLDNENRLTIDCDLCEF